MKFKIEINGSYPDDKERKDDKMEVYKYIIHMEISNGNRQEWIEASKLLIKNSRERIEEQKKIIPETPTSIYEKQRAQDMENTAINLADFAANIGKQIEEYEGKIDNWVFDLANLFEEYYHINFEKAKHINVGDSLSATLLEIDDEFFKTKDEKKLLNTLSGCLSCYNFKVLSRHWNQDSAAIFHVATFITDDLYETNILYL